MTLTLTEEEYQLLPKLIKYIKSDSGLKKIVYIDLMAVLEQEKLDPNDQLETHKLIKKIINEVLRTNPNETLFFTIRDKKFPDRLKPITFEFQNDSFEIDIAFNRRLARENSIKNEGDIHYHILESRAHCPSARKRDDRAILNSLGRLTSKSDGELGIKVDLKNAKYFKLFFRESEPPTKEFEGLKDLNLTKPERSLVKKEIIRPAKKRRAKQPSCFFYYSMFDRGMDLFDYQTKYLLHKIKNFNELINIFSLFGKAILDLHNKGKGHFDIKPDNVSVKVDAKGHVIALFLIDPGSITPFPSNEEKAHYTFSITENYAAPELQGRINFQISAAQDVWSFAASMFVLMTGIYYLKNKMRDLVKAKTFTEEEFDYFMDQVEFDHKDDRFPKLKKLMYQMLMINRNERPSMIEICETLEQLKSPPVVAETFSESARQRVL